MALAHSLSQKCNPASLEGLEDFLETVHYPDARFSLESTLKEKTDNQTRESEQIKVLNAQILLMRAQLEHAFDALERAQQRLAYLKIELCASQDRLKMMPELLIQSARLRYLEDLQQKNQAV